MEMSKVVDRLVKGETRKTKQWCQLTWGAEKKEVIQDQETKKICMKEGSANTSPRPGARPWRNCYRAVQNQGQIGPKVTGTTDMVHTAGGIDYHNP